KLKTIPAGTPFIDSPNTSDPQENHTRLRLLYYVRGRIFAEIPPDTTWYEVKNLTDNELDELHVIAHIPYWAGTDKNELRRVSARCPETLTTPPNDWQRPIL